MPFNKCAVDRDLSPAGPPRPPQLDTGGASSPAAVPEVLIPNSSPINPRLGRRPRPQHNTLADWHVVSTHDPDDDDDEVATTPRDDVSSRGGSIFLGSKGGSVSSILIDGSRLYSPANSVCSSRAGDHWPTAPSSESSPSTPGATGFVVDGGHPGSPCASDGRARQTSACFATSGGSYCSPGRSLAAASHRAADDFDMGGASSEEDVGGNESRRGSRASGSRASRPASALRPASARWPRSEEAIAEARVVHPSGTLAGGALHNFGSSSSSCCNPAIAAAIASANGPHDAPPAAASATFGRRAHRRRPESAAEAERVVPSAAEEAKLSATETARRIAMAAEQAPSIAPSAVPSEIGVGVGGGRGVEGPPEAPYWAPPASGMRRQLSQAELAKRQAEQAAREMAAAVPSGKPSGPKAGGTSSSRAWRPDSRAWTDQSAPAAAAAAAALTDAEAAKHRASAFAKALAEQFERESRPRRGGAAAAPLRAAAQPPPAAPRSTSVTSCSDPPRSTGHKAWLRTLLNPEHDVFSIATSGSERTLALRASPGGEGGAGGRSPISVARSSGRAA